MARPGDVMLVGFVEDELPGRRFVRQRSAWPYHVTLIPWFRTQDGTLDHDLEAFARGYVPFSAEIGVAAGFGPAGNIPVDLIREPADFTRLHTALLGIIEAAGATGYDRRWLGPRYTPHVTRHEGRTGFEEGFAFAVGGFYKVRLEEDNVCLIEKYYKFGGQRYGAAR